MKYILIINEDVQEGERLKQVLTAESTEVLCAYTIQDALDYFISIDLCLVILDANLSVEDDHKLLRAMRKAKSMPILVLSSKCGQTGRLESLQAGAHAYMGDPYTLEECLAQAHSLMQMYFDMNPSSKNCYTLAFGKDLVIDSTRRKVFLKGKELRFTRKEFDLLFCLASNPGKVFSKEQLFDHVWDEYAAYNVDEVIKTHIKTLRQKLSEADTKNYIKNVWGVGYQFHEEEDEA